MVFPLNYVMRLIQRSGHTEIVGLQYNCKVAAWHLSSSATPETNFRTTMIRVIMISYNNVYSHMHLLSRQGE